MTSDEFVEELEEIGDEREAAAAAEEDVERFFLFEVGDRRYALPPGAVREIATDLVAHPLPACPAYVAGLVNCHGVPHAAFDLRVLIEGERLAATTFLVLALERDAVAFGCTEVLEIVEVPRSRVTGFSDDDSGTRFFDAVIDCGGTRVPVLSVERVLRKLESDLG